MVKHIYISPHSDDVALSCGGQIIANPARGEEVLVLNIFTSDSAGADGEAGDIEGRFTGSIGAERTSEDKAAWDSVGVATEHALLPEALLRKRFPFALLSDREDAALADRLHAVLASYVTAHPGATFHFPAGVGGHVDHLACRAAAFRLVDAGLLGSVCLYEDIPYSWLGFLRGQTYEELRRSVAFEGENPASAAERGGLGLAAYLRRETVPFPRGRKLFAAVHASLLARNMLRKPLRNRRYRGTVTTCRLDADGVARKRALLDHYASQIPMLFGDRPDETLRRYGDAFSREVTIEISGKTSA